MLPGFAIASWYPHHDQYFASDEWIFIHYLPWPFVTHHVKMFHNFTNYEEQEILLNAVVGWSWSVHLLHLRFKSFKRTFLNLVSSFFFVNPTWRDALSPQAVILEHWNRKVRPIWYLFSSSFFPLVRCLFIRTVKEHWCITCNCNFSSTWLTFTKGQNKSMRLKKKLWAQKRRERDTFFCFTSTGVLIWDDDAADSSFSFLERFLLASARVVLSSTGTLSIAGALVLGAPVSADALGAQVNAGVLASLGGTAGIACVACGAGCAWTGTGITTGGLGADATGGVTNDDTVSGCRCAAAGRTCFTDRCFEVVVRFELDWEVDSCSWTNIMWSPSRMAKVNGDFPARKSFTCKTNKTVVNALCVAWLRQEAITDLAAWTKFTTLLQPSTKNTNCRICTFPSTSEVSSTRQEGRFIMTDLPTEEQEESHNFSGPQERSVEALSEKILTQTESRVFNVKGRREDCSVS